MDAGIGRRAFLAGSASLARGAPFPQVVYIAARSQCEAPKRLLTEGVAFTRAYAACPDRQWWARTLATGLYAHALAADNSTAGLAGRWVEVSTVADAERALRDLDFTGAFQDTPVVFACNPVGDCPDDRCTRAPLILRYPRKIRGGRQFDFLISTVDVAPTLSGLAGVDLPYEPHGRNLAAFLQSGAGERPESIYSEGQMQRPGEWRMVVRGLDKLVLSRSGQLLHLYNLGEDPEEINDLAREPGHQLKVDELRALVRVWMRRTSDGVDPSGLRRR
jgi:arylsulfatase A-like enzyme